jgi:hypothetical protein
MPKNTRARKPGNATRGARRKMPKPHRRGEDLKRILNILPSKNMDQDWGFENAAEAGVLGAVAAIPASKDCGGSWSRPGD